jgi:predicted DNA-binding transcriptional regulator AlpA
MHSAALPAEATETPEIPTMKARAALPGLMLTEDEAARVLRLSPRTLQRRRLDGDGPPYVQLGKNRIGYRLADLDAWCQSRTVTSTSAVSVGRRSAVA